MKYLTFEKKYFKKKIKNQIYFKDWCLPDGIEYEQINKLNKKEYFDYKFSNSAQIIKNNQFIFKFINKIFPKLVKKMNSYHGVNYNERYWKIILFPWLLPFVSFMHERWHIINSIKNYKNFTFCIYNIRDAKLIIENQPEFGENANQELFNYWTLSKIVKFRKEIKFVEKKIKNTISYQKEKIRHQNSINYKKKIYTFFFTVLSKIFKIQFHLKNLGVSKYKMILLSFKLKQFPFFWVTPEYETEKIQLKKRKDFFYKESSKKNFNNFINEVIHICIPKNYLENYKNIKNSINKSYWPKNIRAILSAHDYIISDVFKIWAAERVLNKETKYLLLQHGGSDGLAESCPGTDLYGSFADKYLTWGWKGKYKNYIPFHSVLLSNQSLSLKKNKKKIYFCILVNSRFTYRYESIPRSNAEKIKKINSIFKIINNINNVYTKDIVLRYLKSAERRNFSKINKNAINKKISYDDGSIPFLKILPDVKIVIHDSNNTGFLECLFFNVPTILILDKKNEKFEKKARKYISLMKKKKIIHYDPKTAIDFLNKNLHNIEKWWNEKKLQSIRKNFCNIYVKKSNNSLNDLSKFLKRTVS